VEVGILSALYNWHCR